MFLSNNPEDAAMREQRADDLRQAWYDGLNPRVREVYGEPLARIITGSVHMDNEQSLAWAHLDLSSLALDSQSAEERQAMRTRALAAIAACATPDSYTEPTGYTHIDMVREGERDALAMVGGNVDDLQEVLHAIQDATAVGKIIGGLVYPSPPLAC